MRFVVATIALSMLAAQAFADAESSADVARFGEPGSRSWTVHVDNDLFAFTDRDSDYTAGVAFSLGGDEARRHRLSPHALLDRVDAQFAFADRASAEAHALDVGLLLFTPQNLSAREPQFDDRPYASLVYVSGSNLRLDGARDVAYQSSLTLGVLGLPLAETLHRSVHDLVGSAEPRGYDHQISDGGEPTFRYAVARKRLLASGSYNERPYTLSFATGASVGYLTEANAEIGFRWGRTSVPWWSSLPASSEYAGHAPIGSERRPLRSNRIEILFDMGVAARARLYNSFLQGQFRDSTVEFSSSEVDRLLFEAWFGVTGVLKNGLSVSYTVRRQTEELEAGPAARAYTWASIGVAQKF